MTETSSILTETGTCTSSSTIPGLGATSGKAFKRLGTALVNGVDAILIRRKMAQLETILGQKTSKSTDSNSLKSLCCDLLELSRDLYDSSIRIRAFRLIMGIVGGMEFEDLAAAVSDWHLSESNDLLVEMMLCFQPGGDVDGDVDFETREADRSWRLSDYQHKALHAYKVELPYRPYEQMPVCIAFLLYMALTISLSQDSAFARQVYDLGIYPFITATYPDILKPRFYSSKELLPAILVFSALIKKLDRKIDTFAITQLELLLAMTATSDSYIQSQDGNVLTPIRSNISYFRTFSHRMVQIEAVLGHYPGSDSANYSPDTESLMTAYRNALEFSLPKHTLFLRTRAFSLIMRIVGGMDFQNLAIAVVRWPSSGLHTLLKAMWLCLCNHLKKCSPSLDLYHTEGLEAYRTATPYQLSPSRGIVYIPFLSFVTLAITLSQDTTFLDLVLDLKILSLIKHLYPEIVRLKTLLLVQHLLRALVEKVDSAERIPPARLQTALTAIRDAENLQKEVKLLTLACRFVPYDQWLVTHVDSFWTIEEVKAWFLEKCIANKSSGDASAQCPQLPPINPPAKPRTKLARRPASPMMFAESSLLDRGPRHNTSVEPMKEENYSDMKHRGRFISLPIDALGSERHSTDNDLSALWDAEGATDMEYKNDKWDPEDNYDMDTIELDSHPGRRANRNQYLGYHNHVFQSLSNWERTSFTTSTTTLDSQPLPTSHQGSSFVYHPNLLTLIRFSTGQSLEKRFTVLDYEFKPYELIEIHRLGGVTKLPREITLEYIEPYWEGWVKTLRVVLSEPRAVAEAKLGVHHGVGRQRGKRSYHVPDMKRPGAYAESVHRVVEALADKPIVIAPSSHINLVLGSHHPPSQAKLAKKIRPSIRNEEDVFSPMGKLTDPQTGLLLGQSVTGPLSKPSASSGHTSGSSSQSKGKLRWHERWTFIKDGVLHLKKENSGSSSSTMRTFPLSSLTELRSAKDLGRKATLIPWSPSQRIVCAKFKTQMITPNSTAPESLYHTSQVQTNGSPDANIVPSLSNRSFVNSSIDLSRSSKPRSSSMLREGDTSHSRKGSISSSLLGLHKTSTSVLVYTQSQSMTSKPNIVLQNTSPLPLSHRNAQTRQERGITDQEDEGNQEVDNHISVSGTEKADPKSEWIVLDLGDEFAFQSFLRVIHRHAPHVINSSFLSSLPSFKPLDVPVPAAPGSTPTFTLPLSSQNQAASSVLFGQWPGDTTQQEPVDCCSITGEMFLVDKLLSEGASPVVQSSSSPLLELGSMAGLASKSISSIGDTPAGTQTSASSPPIATRGSKQHRSPPCERLQCAPLCSSSSALSPFDPHAKRSAATNVSIQSSVQRGTLKNLGAVPYPEWRIKTVMTAQQAGMGDLNRALDHVLGPGPPVSTFRTAYVHNQNPINTSLKLGYANLDSSKSEEESSDDEWSGWMVDLDRQAGLHREEMLVGGTKHLRAEHSC